jgi:RNA polymerase sigma factor for flagellar operon FliA
MARVTQLAPPAQPLRDGGENLLARYRKRPSTRLRNQLIERYRGMVEAMANTLAQRLPASVDPQDLAHAGVWGLIQSLAAYRPERGATFVGFMRARVRGAMLDELRMMDVLPRTLRQRQRRRDHLTERLRAELGRDPTVAELAAGLGMTERRYHLRYAMLQPQAPGEVDPDSLELPQPSEPELGDRLEQLELLQQIEASLEPTEWHVLRLHYLDGLTGKEIARRLRLSPARVCQIHGRVLARLRAKLVRA